MPLHISMGNKKISNSVGLFDLPVVTTCPGAKECLRFCYAMKQEWWGKGRPILRNRVENLKETYKTTFVNDMVNYIKANKINVFRPHDSGDLYSQEYVEKVAEIARRLPDIGFFMYTKSLHLDLTPLTSLPNFTLIFSEGGKYDAKIDKFTDNYARVDEINAKAIKPGEYVCPEIRSSGRKTEKYCAYNCNYCLSSRDTKRTLRHQVRVVFHKSMGGWSGMRLAPRPPGSMVRPLPLKAPQSQKPTRLKGAGEQFLPDRKKAAGAAPTGEATRATRSDAEMAKAVEAELAYRHLLLAGFSKASIIQMTGVKDLSELRREHALQLIHGKAAEEEVGKLKLPVKPTQRGRKRVKHKNT
jgi:hypothetical protein